MQSRQSTHSSRLPSTISTRPSASLKMSTGQTSSSCAASSPSPATASSTSTAMKIPSSCFSANRSPQLLLHRVGNLVDPLDHGDPGALEAGNLLRCRVLGALDDRPGVAEAHPLHLLLVHELSGHEGDD